MEIPISIEVLVTIALFAITAVGGIIAYLISDIRSDLKKIWSKLDCEKQTVNEIDSRVEILETRMNICKQCPAGK